MARSIISPGYDRHQLSGRKDKVVLTFSTATVVQRNIYGSIRNKNLSKE
jgi:hypothetical protein